MNPQFRLKNWKIHPSQRGQFTYELYKAMAENEDIWLVSIDLGYKVFDAHREDFPKRFINTGASEQAALGIACGLALEGKIPFVYTITPFFLRGFETIRTYINHERLNVKLIGSGRDKDYEHDGFSHDATDIPDFMNLFENIQSVYPEKIEDIPDIVNQMVTINKPYFLSLKK